MHPRSLELALKYLRANYPVDEDAAILARVEREMDEEEARNVQRYMPQGGEYGADVNGGAGASHNPSGKSVLEEVRTQNEAYLLAEQERKRQEWLSRGMQHDERVRRSFEKNSLALRNVDEKTALEIAPKGMLKWYKHWVHCWMADTMCGCRPTTCGPQAASCSCLGAEELHGCGGLGL